MWPVMKVKVCVVKPLKTATPLVVKKALCVLMDSVLHAPRINSVNALHTMEKMLNALQVNVNDGSLYLLLNANLNFYLILFILVLIF